MDLLTYGQIKTKILMDLDLETEDFVQAAELLGYVNEAIDECESEIHKLGMEDHYFTSRAYLPLVINEEEYELPSNIYANKIRRVMYHKGNIIFPVRRLRKEEFELYEIYTLYPPPSNFY